MKVLMLHLNESHNQNLAPEALTFESICEFNDWLQATQRDNCCTFLKINTIKLATGVHLYYYCSRSGSSRIITTDRKRQVKMQGYDKIGRTCPAHIKAKISNDGIISVRYVSTHLCHTDTYDQLGHIRLSRKDREWLAGKLALQVPIEVVLKDVRNQLDGSLQRLHIISKKDLHNIERSFNLNKPERMHADDATSVDALVHSYDDKDNTPFIAYKRQGTTTFDILPENISSPLSADDIFIAIMDDAQSQMLVTYGSGDMSVICVDSTHGTNAYDFHLTTIMVLDSNRQGFPAAFLYSNKLTEETFYLWFEVNISQISLKLKALCIIFLLGPYYYYSYNL
jgi:hypothetical protein